VVPGFHCSSLPGMPPSPTPGSPTSLCSRTSMPTWPSPFDHRLGTPEIPAIRFARGADFVASLVRVRYGLPSCSPPCTDRTGSPQPSGTFTTRLSTDWSPSPLLVMTTTVTGLLLLAGLSPAGMAASLAARSKTAYLSMTSMSAPASCGHGPRSESDVMGQEPPSALQKIGGLTRHEAPTGHYPLRTPRRAVAGHS
jgi:hypothetical protein